MLFQSDNALGKAGAQAVAEFLLETPSISTVVTNNTGLSPDGATVVGQALQQGKNTALECFRANRSRVENQGIALAVSCFLCPLFRLLILSISALWPPHSACSPIFALSICLRMESSLMASLNWPIPSVAARSLKYGLCRSERERVRVREGKERAQRKRKREKERGGKNRERERKKEKKKERERERKRKKERKREREREKKKREKKSEREKETRKMRESKKERINEKGKN